MISHLYHLVKWYESKAAKWTPTEREKIEEELLQKAIIKGLEDFLAQDSQQPSVAGS
jgi:hypothetical protein